MIFYAVCTHRIDALSFLIFINKHKGSFSFLVLSTYQHSTLKYMANSCDKNSIEVILRLQ